MVISPYLSIFKTYYTVQNNYNFQSKKTSIMFKNHIKIALRSLVKRKSYAMINIAGLALGIWCCLMISLWIMDEFEQDNFHENGSRICQVLRNQSTENGLIVTSEDTAYPIGDALLAQIPEIENQTRVTNPRNATINFAEKLTAVQMIGADSSFFKIFSFPLKEGSSQNCLQDLKNIVISESLAHNFFPKENVVGKSLKLTINEVDVVFNIAGVFKKLPEQSSLQFDVVIPIDNYLPFNSSFKSWGNSWMVTYILLNDKTSLIDINQKIKNLPKKVADVDWFTLHAQPFKDRYLYSKYEEGKAIGGRIDFIILFFIIALFTLLIACFNFINLTTAWSIKRSKEVGVKKILGAKRSWLLSQFILESTILVTMAVGLAILLAKLSMPVFNEIASKNIAINFTNWNFYAIIFVVALITIALSGIYPAFLLSSFNPVNALKGSVKGSNSPVLLRRGLVVVQFTLSMILVAGTVVVYLQLQFIQSKNLGLDKENVIFLPLDGEAWKHGNTIKTELAKFSEIRQVSAASGNFSESIGITGDPVWEGKNSTEYNPGFAVLDVDFELMEMLNVRLKKGRFFSREFAHDTLNYIINEQAAKAMGINEPLGKSLRFWGEEGGKIVGIVHDFHFRSLHSHIEPMIIRCRPANTELVYVKTMPSKTKETIARLESVHKQFSTLPFKYEFLEETIKKAYQEENKISQLVSIFSGLAIFISCLGLFGLAAFTANQRTREIAVRKVLGASVLTLFRMLSKDFLKLVAIALVLATPITWYYLNDWIQGFAFHITLSWWMFSISGALVTIIAFITVSYQTLRAANRNPAKSLRAE